MCRLGAGMVMGTGLALNDSSPRTREAVERLLMQQLSHKTAFPEQCDVLKHPNVYGCRVCGNDSAEGSVV